MLKEFVTHYHEERNHQGLNNDLIAPGPRALWGPMFVVPLGGLLQYYHRAA